jgi:exosortase A-associated hydrolase 2
LTGPDPYVIAGSAGSLFALHFAATGLRRRAVLMLPPFAEELNKSRRMLSLAARALQSAGIDVLLIDLYGTGDSGGDFGDATLAIWRDDLQRGAAWLAARGVARLDVLAVRGGALLLEDLAPPPGVAHGRVVLWQPVVSGQLLIAQFLRLRVAESMTLSDRGAESPDTRKLLESEGSVEVAGYAISRELVRGLEEITDPLTNAHAWEAWDWFEVSGPGATAPGVAAQRTIAAMRARGMRVRESCLEGEPFWATPEIAVVPALIDATVECLAEPDS